jgi:hypothetical protein
MFIIVVKGILHDFVLLGKAIMYDEDYRWGSCIFYINCFKITPRNKI